MENVRDNRDGSDWPCSDTRVLGGQIVVKMAGASGYARVTSGGAGAGAVIVNNNRHTVDLPGLTSRPGTLEVTFRRR